jgi:hypothetical protein
MKHGIWVLSTFALMVAGFAAWKAEINPVYSVELSVGHRLCEVFPDNKTSEDLCGIVRLLGRSRKMMR